MALWVFTLSITPQTFLHDWVAGHRDTPSQWHTGPEKMVGKAGVDCHFNDLVSTSPFLDADPEIRIAAPVIATQLPTPFVLAPLLSQPSYWEGRGPPSIG